MASGSEQTPREDELRRRAARLADREEQLARRERDVSAREAELACGDVDRRLRRIVLGDRAPSRPRDALADAAAAVVAVWLMAFPLAFAAERAPLHAAVLAAGAALAFLTLARGRLERVATIADGGLGALGTWLLAWGGLGHATTAAGWALAATGAVVWALALVPRRG